MRQHLKDYSVPKNLELQLPGSSGAVMALRSDGIMAVMDSGCIRICDWK